MVKILIFLVVVIGVSQLDAKEYEMVTALKLNWHQASEFCRRFHWRLATVESAEDTAQLTKQLKIQQKAADIELSWKGGFWTSGNDFGKKDLYMWGASGKIIDYTNWGKDEPNTLVPAERCVQLITEKMEWNDEPCEREKNFICEKFIRSH